MLGKLDLMLRTQLVSAALALLFPASAGAASKHYVLAEDSTITPTGESAQLLIGTLDLTYRGFCVEPFDPGDCALYYDLDDLDLTGGGESVALEPITPIIDALPDLRLWDFGLDHPGSPHLDLVIDRDTQPAHLQGEARYLERGLLTPDENTAPDAIFDGDPLPSNLFVDVELIEKELLQILGGGGQASFPSTVSTKVVARLSIHAVAVPEPGSAALGSTALITLGLIFASTRARRRSGARL
jgi:hypothetical protein